MVKVLAAVHGGHGTAVGHGGAVVVAAVALVAPGVHRVGQSARRAVPGAVQHVGEAVG